jgi:ribonucleoside-diphosphate reductase alpha chain
VSLEELQVAKEAPSWYDSRSFETVQGGYLLPGETPKGMYRRVAKAAALEAERPDLEEPFFMIMWEGWLGPATPVLSNMGTNRGLPISCYKTEPDDSVDSIFKVAHEIAMMSKCSGGVGIILDNIRSRGSPIANGSKSNGIVPWCQVYDVVVRTVAQGNRRGAASVNLDIESADWDEFVEMRNTEGDPARRVKSLHLCTLIKNSFMEKALAGDEDACNKLRKLLHTRWENGEPYVLFYDHVNDAVPKEYKDRGFKVKGTNICSEILQYTDTQHSVVCCLSSLNLASYHTWKLVKINDMSVIELGVRFLDAVMTAFIRMAKEIPGLDKAVRGAEKARSLGLGVMGWHSLLQSQGMAFDTSWDVMQLNAEISRKLRTEADEASQKLASEYGEPEWLVGSGRRNMHLLAYAPTRSNSTICGGVSPSIEPWVSNYYLDEAAKGDFPVKNKELQKLLASKNKDVWEVWKTINKAEGSVQHLDFLSEHEKKVFRTAREIDQKTLITQAAQRQRWVDQGQSLNLFYPLNIDAQKVMDDFVLAWEMKVQTLYYERTGAAIKGDVLEECESCQG